MINLITFANFLPKKGLSLVFVRQMMAICFFALLYWIGDKIDAEKNASFSKSGGTKEEIHNITLYDALYFSLVTQTTVGYGDIVPQTVLTKTINIIQLLSIYGVIVISLI